MKSGTVDERRAAAKVAAGLAPATRILRGGRVVNVDTGLIQRSDIAIVGSRIAAIGDVSYTENAETEVIDVSGQFVLPGFIDSHIHAGGSQLTVQRLAEVMLPHGTVAIATDFYELGYLGGVQAVLDEVEASEGSGLQILLSVFNAAVLGIGEFGNLERFSYEDMDMLLGHPACVELREWNCWSDWLPLDGQQVVYEKALALGKTIGGHLEGLTGPNLQASVALGVTSEHEAGTVSEAMDLVKLGLTVQVRGGSAARDFYDLIPALTEKGAPPSLFSFCTDELELPRMAHEGHIDRMVRLAVRAGVAPIDAIRMATQNAARSVGAEKDLGSIVPGKLASIVTVDDLANFNIRSVISQGELAAKDGKYLLTPEPWTYSPNVKSTVNIGQRFETKDFLFNQRDGEHTARVVGLVPGKLVTQDLEEDIVLNGGRVVQDDSSLVKLAVIDRHDGGKEKFVGLIRGCMIGRGAIATTVNPGMMNLIVVGADEEDMAVAANRVAELQGGICVAVDGEIISEVALPVCGIVSDQPSADVLAACSSIESAIANNMSCRFDGLLSAVGFACLAVSIPSLKMTSRGLVRVNRGEPGQHVDLFV